SRSSQLLASFDIEFAGRKDGDAFYHDGTLRDPKIWDATFIQRSAQFIHFDGIGSEEQQRFTFRFIRHSANGDASLASFHTESIDNLLLDYFVWHHFTANLGEARKPAFDVQKSVLVQPANVACLQPAVTENFGRSLWIVQITFKNVRTAQPQHPAIVNR